MRLSTTHWAACWKPSTGSSVSAIPTSAIRAPAPAPAAAATTAAPWVSISTSSSESLEAQDGEQRYRADEQPQDDALQQRLVTYCAHGGHRQARTYAEQR